jgi:hypothetical protein
VHPECFGHLTALLKTYAPLGLLLEGGYNLSATAACVESCLRVLLGEQPMPLRGTRWVWSACLHPGRGGGWRGPTTCVSNCSMCGVVSQGVAG